jgi:hypothetical protein
MQRSKLVLGSVITLAVLGLGAGAVALESGTGGDGSLADGTTTTTVAPSTTTSTTVAPTTTIAPALYPVAPVGDDTSDTTGDEGVERSTDGCDGGTYANHGDYVSSVAHDPDRAPGDVAAAAHSDCGKPLSAVGGAPDDATDAPDTDAPAAPGNGNGNGNTNGHSK